MATKTRRSATTKKPELKVGPFQGGIGVAVWLNDVQTDSGPRQLRSVTIAPRRYLDRKTGEWKDAGSYRPSDLTALILALEKAREFCLTTALPGEQSADERMNGLPQESQDDA